MATNGTNTPSSPDRDRIIAGSLVAVLGLILVGVALVVAVMNFKASNDVVAIIGSITGVVGTVVGAVFGVNVGSAGTASANAARKDAEDKASKLALLVPPEHATEAAALL